MSMRIDEVALPESIDDESAAAALFRGFVDTRNLVRREAWGGSADLDFSYRETFMSARDSVEERQHRFAAVIDDRVVGVCRVEVSRHEMDAPARLLISVLPQHRRQGIGSALLTAAAAVIRDEGRAYTQLGVEHPEGPGPRLVASTGHGSIPADNAEAQALTKAGFTLEQAERVSRLELDAASVEHLAEQLEAATTRSAGYRLETWQGKTPKHLLQTMAALGARMSTDAPAGGLEAVEEVWHADRLAAFEHNEIEGQGRRYLQAAAFDGDEAVAYTKLLLPNTGTRQAIQQDTLVHGDHRGHRLGLRVKAANLLQLRQEHPDFDRVITWNAEENQHMLAVNDQLGFGRVLVEGAWQRRER
ncbi:GNAT family N-acetyltransferase [Agrococcus casei]|uniref:GNAT family N-acetyltransferase n=1 Tax=Agrococcus casei TaxID=343512 RepID=UPI003F8E5623